MMKKCVVYLLLYFSCIEAIAQDVTNIVMVGPGGVTEDVKSATGFIVIKQYPDLHFERLDYKKGGPLVKLRSYKDKDLTILDGRYFEYAIDGALSISGKYVKNQKDGDWKNYDDTGKVIKSVRYENDSIIEVFDVDKEDSEITYPDERGAEFPGGDKAWIKYLQKKLKRDNPANKSFHGGRVYINFTIGTDGSMEDVFVSKSAEYILDETSLKIISSSPKWNPAFQNGENVRAYRKQPLTFVQQE